MPATPAATSAALPAALPADFTAMMERGVSVIVGSRDARLRPSLMRAVGSRIEAGGRTITVYLARRQARQVIQDIAATGQVAVVFSQPSTHRTVQLKAGRASMRNAGPDDAPGLAAYLAAMEQELQCIGLEAGMAGAMLAHRLDDVVAVSFVPEQAFDQTPGPRAGTALGAAR